jgi:hypothetical protein
MNSAQPSPREDSNRPAADVREATLAQAKLTQSCPFDLAALEKASGLLDIEFKNPTRRLALELQAVTCCLTQIFAPGGFELPHAEVATDPPSDWGDGLTDARKESNSVIMLGLCLLFNPDETLPPDRYPAFQKERYQAYSEFLKSHERWYPPELRAITLEIGCNDYHPGVIVVSADDIRHFADRDWSETESHQSSGGYFEPVISAVRRFRQLFSEQLARSE